MENKKTSFHKFMDATNLVKIELGLVDDINAQMDKAFNLGDAKSPLLKVEFGVLQDAYKQQMVAITARTKIRKSLDALRDEIANAKKSTLNAISLYDKAQKDAKALGMDTSQIDTPLKATMDMFDEFNAISQKLIGLGK